MTATPSRVVLDTNVLVSAILRPTSVAARALLLALRRDVLLSSADVLEELEEVLTRRKFEGKIALVDRAGLLLIVRAFEPVPIQFTVTDCRDPKDNKFLELALSGKADLILTGDQDLLALHPWRGISILSPSDYLATT